ncbi:AfsR/SARP family transcriptional regulator [Murinocardiopsis flavida]|uniref:AfsR/SARP family transcriptional regulator n=1 Tax=Murinocardiopsis flavida TaxID=645275 RepID=UPI001FEAEAB0|nr:BTAD domain-containing putative transcriptional regulator [Murinocardiopsis flavida]
MKFRVLGPVSAWGSGGRIPVGGPRQQCVLGTLLVELGKEVTAERLTELLWGEDPPRTSRSIIHVQISHLRRAFPSLIQTSAGGYVAVADPDDVDLHRFRRLVGAAHASADLAAAYSLWDEALSVWEGRPFSGIGSDRLWYALCLPLIEEHWNALTSWAESAFELGRYGTIAERLTSTVYEEPLRERLSFLLIAALYRNGDRAAAMSAYHSLRERLADELGVDPGPEIVALYQEMLSEPDRQEAPQPPVQRPRAALGTGEPVRNDLPRDIPDFAGREADLAWLLDVAADDSDQAVVRVVTGPGGAGKTTLAVHAAHRLAARYPDGVLFIDLYGFAVEREPLSAAAALGRLLRAIGVEPDAVPDSTDERAALWRALLAGRRTLIVLDNAVGFNQVDPLLAATPGSLTLITTRHDLPGLNGVGHLSLGMLDESAAVALFTAVIGADRVAGEEDAALAVARLCGGLPLALRIVAGRMATRPRWTFAHAARRLSEEHLRMRELEADGRSVRAIFELSFQTLTGPQREVFLTLGMMIGSSIDLYGAAALLDMRPDDADDAVQELVSVCLIEEKGVDLYRFHDLLGVYARERALAELPAGTVADARRRLSGHYLATAQRASDWLGWRRHEDAADRTPDSRYDDDPVPNRDRAISWFDTHQQNLASVVDHFAEHDDSERAWRMADSLWRYYAFNGQTDLWYATHEKALAASRAQSNDIGRAVTLVGLGIANCLSGRFALAVRNLQEARRVFVGVGDREGEIRVLANLGMVYEREGRFRDALDVLGEVVEHSVATGDRLLETQHRANLAMLFQVQGDTAQTVTNCEIVLDTGGDERYAEHWALASRTLGEIKGAQGEAAESLRHLEYALVLFDRLGNQTGEIYTRNSIAVTLRESGDLDAAIEAHRYALELGEKTAQHSADAQIRNALAATYERAGRVSDARSSYEHALRLAHERGERYAEAAARFGLALLPDTGAADAAALLTRAAETFAALGVPEADRARAELDRRTVSS